jgi:DNA-binding NarL/FixJ family response regulator
MPVHVLLDDLFFRTRIEATASAAGVRVVVSGTVADLLERMRESWGAVLVDLGGGMPGDGPEGGSAIAAIQALKRLPDPPRVVAWGSHVDAKGFEAARAAGADRVLPRSAFTRRLPEILRELSGS